MVPFPSDIKVVRHGKNGSFLPEHITFDSRKVRQGSAFAALSGVNYDGHDFIGKAIAAGAKMIIHSLDLEFYDPEIEYIQSSSPRATVSGLIRAQYGNPDSNLQLFGITGTNGKTTGVFLLRHILSNLNKKCGLISTVEYDDTIAAHPPTHTTPDPETLFPLLRTMVENGAHAAAMEFSSHALAQQRVDHLKVKGAIFTNLTGDHLDFHGSKENYFAAKMRLFTEFISPGGVAAINIDDPAGKIICERLRRERNNIRCFSFGKDPEADFKISDIASDADGSNFTLSYPSGSLSIEFPLAGSYNVSNLAGVLTLLATLGFSAAELAEALKGPFRVPGRLDKLTAPNGARFYVDFAHTDDALINVLKTLRPCCRGILTILFGAGGDRDRTKRPRMGKAAADYADRVIITSDNPRSEEPQDIITEIISGISDQNCELHNEVDRRSALRLAALLCRPDDVVIVAGKGHENYQEIKGVKNHFDDREELLELFRNPELFHG